MMWICCTFSPIGLNTQGLTRIFILILAFWGFKRWYYYCFPFWSFLCAHAVHLLVYAYFLLLTASILCFPFYAFLLLREDVGVMYPLVWFETSVFQINLQVSFSKFVSFSFTLFYEVKLNTDALMVCIDQLGVTHGKLCIILNLLMHMLLLRVAYYLPQIVLDLQLVN